LAHKINENTKLNSINNINDINNNRKFSILDIESSNNNHFNLIHITNESFNSKNLRDGPSTVNADNSSSLLNITANMNENALNSLPGDKISTDYNFIKSRGIKGRYSMAFYTLAASQ
jgi:hypothetical protein